MDDLLRIGEVAKQLGVSVMTVWRHSRRAVDPLPSHELETGSSERRFVWEEVVVWLERQKVRERERRLARAREELARARAVVERLEREIQQHP